MKIFNKKIVESSTPPSNTNVLWADIDENDKSLITLKKFLNGEWEDIIKREEEGGTTDSGIVVVPFNTYKSDTPTEEEISELINKCMEALSEDKICIIKCDVNNTSSGGGIYYFYVMGYSSGNSTRNDRVISAIGLPGTVWTMYPNIQSLNKLFILTAYKYDNTVTLNIRELGGPNILEIGNMDDLPNSAESLKSTFTDRTPTLLISTTGFASNGGGIYYYYMIGKYYKDGEGYYFIGTDNTDFYTDPHSTNIYLLHLYSKNGWTITKQSLIETVPTLDLTPHLSELESFVPTQNEVNAIVGGYMLGELKVILGESIYKLKVCSEMPTGNSGTIKMNNTSIGFDNNKLCISTFITLELVISEENQYTISVTGSNTPTLTVIDLSSLIS